MRHALTAPRRLAIAAALACSALLGTPAAHAADAAPTICVWDPLGPSGPIFDAAKNYALQMQGKGMEIKLKSYTDERVASEDFRVGQCQGLMATSLRTKTYNPTPGAMDYGGTATIVRDGKIDMDASYEVVRKAIALFSSPAAAKLVVNDKYELGGILPTGAVYTFVRDRNIFKKGFAGAKLPALDDDKVQSYLIQRIGAQAIACDISNFVTRFNNGALDAIFAPAIAYKPLEIYRGVGTNGGVSRLPLAFTSMQIVFDRSKFPSGFGEASREAWARQVDNAIATARKADKDIPQDKYIDLDMQAAVDFVSSQRDTRVDLAEKGFYDKQGLKIMKRIRCNINNAAAECSTKAELDWGPVAQK
jgi:hypothetical protein